MSDEEYTKFREEYERERAEYARISMKAGKTAGVCSLVFSFVIIIIQFFAPYPFLEMAILFSGLSCFFGIFILVLIYRTEGKDKKRQ
ncbi:MAG: hypothetical protein ACFFCS_15060 [Candidatus Hodarchaeota archaeon]